MMRNAEKKWKNVNFKVINLTNQILNAMIRIIDSKQISKNVVKLLNLSGLIKTQRNAQLASITSEGFKFVLMKPEEQVSSTANQINFVSMIGFKSNS